MANGEPMADGLPTEFHDLESLRAWGGRCPELAFGPHRLAVVLRCVTFGMRSCEPFVFVERDGVWRRLLHGERRAVTAEANIEGDWLVIRQLTGGPVEWLRLNLAVVLPPAVGGCGTPARAVEQRQAEPGAAPDTAG